MPQEGVHWYVDPGVLAQKFSVFAKELPYELEEVVLPVLMSAAKEMRGTVIGLDRIKTSAMLNSIGGRIDTVAGGRIRGQYGYIDAAPYWSVFQEYGTRGRHGGMDRRVDRPLAGETPGNRGIHPMHAFVAASVMVEQELHARISRLDIWKGFR